VVNKLAHQAGIRELKLKTVEVTVAALSYTI
jgi:hypothetical protein